MLDWRTLHFELAQEILQFLLLLGGDLLRWVNLDHILSLLLDGTAAHLGVAPLDLAGDAIEVNICQLELAKLHQGIQEQIVQIHYISSTNVVALLRDH